MRSPVNFAVLGLVIERPSYGYELSKRLQSRFGELLEVRSPSHVYAALDRLQGEGLVEGMQAEEPAVEGPSRQPKVHYRATAAGAFAYRQWLAERLRDDEERIELLGKLITVGVRDIAALGDLLDRYDEECVAATQRMPLADRSAAESEPPAEFVRRLVAEERRFVLEAQLRWIDFAREELRAREERRRRRMSLLSLAGVSKRYSDARRMAVALDDVSIAVEAGEVVAVWGGRGSGRTTLLRVASGLEQPDTGRVVFDGLDLAAGAEAATARGLAYVQPRLVGPQRQPLIDRLSVALVARGRSKPAARDAAEAVLTRVGAVECAEVRVGELDAVEAVRVGIAQALLFEPKLLVVDEPTATVPLIERDGVLALLRSVADAGVAVLMTAGEAIGLSGVDRALTISGGRLHANVTAGRAEVIPLRPAAGA